MQEKSSCPKTLTLHRICNLKKTQPEATHAQERVPLSPQSLFASM